MPAHALIRIREAEPGDGSGIIEFFNLGLERGLNTFTGLNTPIDPKESAEFDRRFGEKERGTVEFVAIDTRSGKVVGSCTFHGKDSGRTRHRGELGFGLHPDYLRKGIATQLLEATLDEAAKRGFVRAEMDVAARNERSLALAMRCGFSVEGRRKRGMLLDDGEWVDTIILAKIIGR